MVLCDLSSTYSQNLAYDFKNSGFLYWHIIWCRNGILHQSDNFFRVEYVSRNAFGRVNWNGNDAGNDDSFNALLWSFRSYDSSTC